MVEEQDGDAAAAEGEEPLVGGLPGGGVVLLAAEQGADVVEDQEGGVVEVVFDEELAAAGVEGGDGAGLEVGADEVEPGGGVGVGGDDVAEALLHGVGLHLAVDVDDAAGGGGRPAEEAAAGGDGVGEPEGGEGLADAALAGDHREVALAQPGAEEGLAAGEASSRNSSAG